MNSWWHHRAAVIAGEGNTVSTSALNNAPRIAPSTHVARARQNDMPDNGLGETLFPEALIESIVTWMVGSTPKSPTSRLENHRLRCGKTQGASERRDERERFKGAGSSSAQMRSSPRGPHAPDPEQDPAPQYSVSADDRAREGLHCTVSGSPSWCFDINAPRRRIHISIQAYNILTCNISPPSPGRKQCPMRYPATSSDSWNYPARLISAFVMPGSVSTASR